MASKIQKNTTHSIGRKSCLGFYVMQEIIPVPSWL